MARIDRLEAQIERQQKRDKAARVLAARTMLKRRQGQPHGMDGATRGHRRVAQVTTPTLLESCRELCMWGCLEVWGAVNSIGGKHRYLYRF